MHLKYTLSSMPFCSPVTLDFVNGTAELKRSAWWGVPSLDGQPEVNGKTLEIEGRHA